VKSHIHPVKCTIAPMKTFIAPAVLLLAVAAPAHATGGLICSTAGTRSVEAALVISHTAVPAIVSARLTEAGRNIPVRVAQAWLETGEIRIDLVDPNAVRHELRLRAKWNGRTFDGSIWRNAKRSWIRCRES
jgi:hypothetical protein